MAQDSSSIAFFLIEQFILLLVGGLIGLVFTIWYSESSARIVRPLVLYFRRRKLRKSNPNLSLGVIIKPSNPSIISSLNLTLNDLISAIGKQEKGITVKRSETFGPDEGKIDAEYSGHSIGMRVLCAPPIHGNIDVLDESLQETLGEDSSTILVEESTGISDFTVECSTAALYKDLTTTLSDTSALVTIILQRIVSLTQQESEVYYEIEYPRGYSIRVDGESDAITRMDFAISDQAMSLVRKKLYVPYPITSGILKKLENFITYYAK